MSEPIRSRPYSTASACEKCVFGRGCHAEWCIHKVFDDYVERLFPSSDMNVIDDVSTHTDIDNVHAWYNRTLSGLKVIPSRIHEDDLTGVLLGVEQSQTVTQFTCAACHGTFDKQGTDEERDAEAEQIFGKHPKDWPVGQPMIICDDCFRLIDPKNHPDQVEASKRFMFGDAISTKDVTIDILEQVLRDSDIVDRTHGRKD